MKISIIRVRDWVVSLLISTILRIAAFPEHETRLHLGGHSMRTRYLHIDLVKSPGGWVLESILMCR